MKAKISRHKSKLSEDKKPCDDGDSIKLICAAIALNSLNRCLEAIPTTSNNDFS